MVKKIISFATAIFMLCCMIPFGAFADDVLDDCPKCGKHTYETWKDYSTSVPDLGFPVSGKKRHCTSCKYSYYEWNVFGICGYKDFDNGGEGLIDGFFMDYLKDWCSKTFGKDGKASGFQTGGGSASPGGVGRNPAGYADQGVPSVNSSGFLYLNARYSGFVFSEYYRDSPSTFLLSDKPSNVLSDVSGSGLSMGGGVINIFYEFTVPCDGIYFVPMGIEYNFGFFNIFDHSNSKWINRVLTYKAKSDYENSTTLKKGETVYFCLRTIVSYASYPSKYSYKYSFAPSVVIACDPLVAPVNKQTNVTINNNTWNGNIYVDNTNKLTYIYPQYTVNNETKISNNPIIYNEETKQYYTYDSVTNNYYYITYGDPAPTPTPSPSPDPGGSTPDPGKPTPTPTPGGSDSSGGGSGFNPFKWLADLLKDIVEGIFKTVWKLITSIFGFLIWLVGLLGNVLPFLPSEGLAALSAAAIIITVIRIIKFILGR